MGKNHQATILIVDDNEVSRYSTTRILLQAGFEVIEAASGEEALKLAIKNPDLIILDVNLPYINGFEVCRQIKTNPSTATIPVLYLSAIDDTDSKVKGMESGADCYLTHPVEPQVLIATINSLLRIRKVEREKAKAYRELANIMEAVSDIVFMLDQNGRLIRWNKKAEEVSGFSHIEAFERPAIEFFIPEDREVVAKAIFQVLDKGEGEVEAHLLSKDGKKFHYHWRAVVFRDEDGKIVGLTGIGRDITERKKAEAEREKLIKELQETLTKVKLLSGLLPICASCKKVRDDKGYWTQIEAYIREHSEAEFSHGLCPECMKKLYPEIDIDSNDN